MRSVGIVGLGSYVPENVVTNLDLEQFVDTNDEWIVSRTGIKQRHIAPKDMPVSELCYQAGLKALEDAQIAPEEVELIIVATITPDYAFPATACLVADRLGAKNAAAFDLEAGCTGFIYAVATGSQFIASGLYKTVLVIGGETLSKILNWQDRSTCVLFGDGAGAAVLQQVEEGFGFLSFELGSDGSGGALLSQPAGGSKCPASLETVEKNLHTLQMEGKEVYKFAVRIMGDVSVKVLQKAGLTKDDIDLLVPHQANMRIVDAAVKRLGISKDKVVINLDKYGNMSAASIPIALDEAFQAGLITEGDIIVMVGFGTGLTWGACVLKWTKVGLKR
ncbi:beta-ketoacyl-ACP synthase III [Desulfosporosinus sp. BICA1-9]|uniref:beta-ketoacyl-ACP synthase III n=1 Tax=Desulfosporosinus sp. BICA1-9 TaxID=1531958 RepID=UPI00054C7634|nr:beta-ketoacyl-ACP synthase III [Desulfosporosinus sp. BICA1-9]KJS48676.1 MAG: 3-oxoacyl-ACP synthase [Peptococcaceae bacterium BRH_c23]KJS90505.1 MAG: 3-oxoacyl-ACP synthase [Desulfosporosinus sp. BICA1-9]HBW36958.1 ketoacyl-ACP synthase III [Desulfosporosinus sp.]